MQFYLKVSDAWEAMFNDCQNAAHSIELEQYILEDDVLGKRFLKLFAEKAAAGISVRVILDSFGSSAIRTSKLVEQIKANGGRVIFYRPLWWFHIFFPNFWLPRNHSKILIVDGKIAYTGGVCLAKYMAGWRDTQMRITEPLVQVMSDDYAKFWAHLAGDKEVPPPSRKEGRHKLEYAVHNPHRGRNVIYKALLNKINNAGHSICLATPYLYPPHKLRRALKQAAGRGVKVTVMLSEKTDVFWADKAARLFLRFMLYAGFEVLFYRPTVLHAKYAVIDDTWATVGSMNFDRLSLLYNREVNIIIHDPALVAEVKGHFIEDQHMCVHATTDDWNNQPFWHKCVGWMMGLLHKIW